MMLCRPVSRTMQPERNPTVDGELGKETRRKRRGSKGILGIDVVMVWGRTKMNATGVRPSDKAVILGIAVGHTRTAFS